MEKLRLESGADRGSSGEPDGNPAGQSEREVSGTEQGEGPAGMGGTSEQPDGDGRRNRLEGIGIQLTEPTTEQDLSEAEEEIASAFSFPDSGSAFCRGKIGSLLQCRKVYICKLDMQSVLW